MKPPDAANWRLKEVLRFDTAFKTEIGFVTACTKATAHLQIVRVKNSSRNTNTVHCTFQHLYQKRSLVNDKNIA